jgi:hypothetical protein
MLVAARAEAQDCYRYFEVTREVLTPKAWKEISQG